MRLLHIYCCMLAVLAEISPDKQVLASDNVLYLVFPSPVQPHNHGDRIQAALETWAPGQQVVWVQQDEASETDSPHGSAHTNVTLHTSLHPTLSVTLWLLNTPLLNSDKAWRVVLARALKENWDWLMRLDDLGLVLPSNLHLLLQGHRPQRPWIMGTKLKLPGSDKAYFSAGPGWVVSRPTVEGYMHNWCPSDNPWFAEKNYDIVMHSCMMKHKQVSVVAADGNNKQLFNTYGPVRSFLGTYDDWFVKYKHAAGEQPGSGKHCCSEYPVSFHYLESDEQRALYDLLTHKDKWSAMTSDERMAAWRNNGKRCPYSAAIPAGRQAEGIWDFLISHLQQAPPAALQLQ